LKEDDENVFRFTFWKFFFSSSPIPLSFSFFIFVATFAAVFFLPSLPDHWPARHFEGG
jgi:hypothetical protein